MIEKRRSPRKIADEVLQVSDKITGTYIGQVVNISAEGLMLLSQEPIVMGSVYQLEMEISEGGGDIKRVSFGAEAVWTTEATQPDSYWTGFRIIDISTEGVLSIDDLILEWHSSE
jgi:sporulation protein YlmC with PRC-barrel domain